jgi:hypothetical protein
VAVVAGNERVRGRGKALQKDVLIPQLIDLIYLRLWVLGFEHVLTILDNCHWFDV